MADADAFGINASDDLAELCAALTTAIESFPDMFFILGAVFDDDGPADFLVDFANEAACEKLGLSLKDIRGESVGALLPSPGHAGLLLSTLREAAATQRTLRAELAVVFPEDDPQARWLARCVPDGKRLFLSVAPDAAPAAAVGPLANQEDFARAMEGSPLGIALVTRDKGQIESTNAVMARILGSGARFVAGSFFENSLGIADRRRFAAALERLNRTPGVNQHLAVTVKGGDGKRRSVKVAMTAVGADKVFLQVLDQTEDAHRLALASQCAEEFELLAQSMSDAVLRLDTKGEIRWASPSAKHLLGVPAGEVKGRLIWRFVARDFARALNAAMVSAAAGGEVPDFLLRVNQQDADPIWARASTRPIRTPTGGIGGVVLAMRDADAEMKAKAKLEDLALRDPLSGMGTRQAMVARLNEELAAPGARVSLIEVHLDQLGRLNEAITFSGADEVIATIAERLRSFIGARGEAFRIAGSDFGVIVREPESVSHVLALAERLRTVCGLSIKVGGHTVTPSLSVGVALATGADVHRLLYDSHRAMRTAKTRGRNQVAVADDRGGLEATRWLVDEAELSDALREGRYAGYFQPIVTLSDGVLAGFEVLVRCRQPDGRAILPPGQIAVAEATGLIKDIDRLVMRQALQMLTKIDGRYFVSINASVRSLAEPSYLPWVEELVQDMGIEPSRVHIEVTETTALAVPPSVRRAMEHMADVGFSWYMDDFGTGYSSLSSLRDLPMGGLKLDRSFTALLVPNADRIRNLTQGIVRLAGDMGLVTVAEGVEKQEEADLLALQGWSYGQGWLYGRAMPIAEALELAGGDTLPAARAGAG